MGHDDEDAIRRQIDTLAKAIGAQDLDSLKQVYAADIVSYDIEPPLQHLGIDAKLENWAHVFAVFGQATYEVRDLVLVLGDDLAYGHAFARLSGTLKDGTATSGTWVRVTYAFRKRYGVWLITHDHVSVPMDLERRDGVGDLEP